MTSKEQYLLTISLTEEFLKKAKNAYDNFSWAGNKHTASAKRASMELTRSLADFRRP